MTQKCRLLKNLLSLVLAIVMVVGIVPPIEVSAAVLKTPTINSPDEDETYYDTASISFKWGSVSGATYYKYAIKDMTSGELLKNSDRYTSRSVTLSKSYLEPGHEIKFTVGAYNDNGEASNWATVYIIIEEQLEEASTTFDLDDTTVTLGETIGLSGKVDSGDYYIRAIEVNIRNDCDSSHGYNHERVEFDYSDKRTSYYLSNFDDIETGITYKCSGCGKTETLGVGEHEAVISVGLYSPTGGSAEGFTEDGYYFEVEEPILEGASTTFKLDDDLVTLGETIGLSGKVDSGDYYIRAIEVNIRNNCDSSHGYNHQRVEFDYSDKRTSYYLSNFDDIETGITYKCSGCGKTETLGGGEHEAVISVGLYSPTGGSAEGFTEDGYYFEVEEPILEDASTTFKLDSTEIELGETIGLSGTVDSGDYYIRAIEVNIRNNCDISHGYNHQRVEFDYSDKRTSYSLSNFEDIKTNMSYTCSGCGKTETLGAGEHEAVISVGLYSPTGGSAEGFTTEGYNFSITTVAGGNAIINDISSSDNKVSVGEEIKLTVKANTNVYGVEFHVKDNGNDYTIGSVKTVSSSTSTTKTFIFDEYSFNSTGLIEDGLPVENTREVWAYPIDKNGDVIEDDSVADYCEITVTPSKYALGNFTAYDTTVELGNNATIRWTTSEAETNDTVYYNVYIGTKTSTILLTPDKISARSITVDSSIIKELGTGTYAVMVIATAANHSQKQANANITINASTVSDDTTKPMINPISCSADPIVFGTSVTFSTAASDETALNRVEMYVDGALVKKVSATDTYANISYTTDSLSSGSHTVLVKAYDEAGNENSWSQSFTVKTISAGIVYDVELSDYDFYAGSYITFTVKTSKDTTKIRLVDGSYAFSVQSSGYKDSGNYRIWTFEQYVGTVGTNRKLRVESYSNGWTGNYYTTEPFTVRKNIEDVGTFEILSPVSGDKHQVNTSLTVTWSEPSVKPDWYVVNVSGVPSGSGWISINGNSAVISGRVFNEYGTYSISVTAQKSGYNQSETYTNVVVGCLHEDRTLVGVKYGSEVYYNDSKHKVVVTPKYSCNICGGTFTNSEEATTEYIEHNHDVELDNNGWFCDCGYVDSGSYTPWTGYLQSNSKEKAYNRVMSDGELTNWDGVSKVYPEDTITVVGTKFDAFLIQYSLDSGGTKTRFVDRTLVDRMEYTGRSIVYVSIDGIDLRCIQEGNGTLYASAYDLATVLNGSCSFISNNKLYCRMKVYDSVSALNYYWEADLRNYNARSNWQNLNAYTDESLTTLAKSAFAGAYVYCGEINISIKGVLELLSYESVGENSYSKKNIDYELIKTAQTIRDTSGQFNRVYNLMRDGTFLVGGEYATYAYSIAKFDVNGLTDKILDDSSGDVVEAIKQSLLTNRTEEDANEAYDALKLFYEISDKTAKGVDWTVKTSHNIVISTLEDQIKDTTDEIERLKAAGEDIDTTTLDKLNKDLANSKDALKGYEDSVKHIGIWLKGIGLGFDVIDAGKFTYDQLYTAGLLAQNYDSNIALLDTLISNADSAYMKKVYQNVKSELKSYYSDTVTGYFNTIIKNPETRGAIFDLTTDVVEFASDCYEYKTGKSPIKDILEKKLGKAGGGYLLAHAAVAAAADVAFKGEDLYGAASQLYIAADVLPEMVDEVNKAIKVYRNNPSPDNHNNLIFTAKNLANYRIITLDACKKYEDSLVIANFFFNDEYQVSIKNIENEKAKIESLMNSLN